MKQRLYSEKEKNIDFSLANAFNYIITNDSIIKQNDTKISYLKTQMT